MFGKLRNIAPVAMIGAFLQGPKGRAAIAKAKAYATDPNNRRKAMGAINRLARRR